MSAKSVALIQNLSIFYIQSTQIFLKLIIERLAIISVDLVKQIYFLNKLEKHNIWCIIY